MYDRTSVVESTVRCLYLLTVIMWRHYALLFWNCWCCWSAAGYCCIHMGGYCIRGVKVKPKYPWGPLVARCSTILNPTHFHVTETGKRAKLTFTFTHYTWPRYSCFLRNSVQSSVTLNISSSIFPHDKCVLYARSCWMMNKRVWSVRWSTVLDMHVLLNTHLKLLTVVLL